MKVCPGICATALQSRVQYAKPHIQCHTEAYSSSLRQKEKSVKDISLFKILMFC